MLQYIDNNGDIGVIPTSFELTDISKKIQTKLTTRFIKDILIPIPNSANDLVCFFSYFTQHVLLNKKNWNEQLLNWTKAHSVVLLDDVLCHGETIMSIINSKVKLNNIKLIIILYHIVSENICLYDIEEKKFTLCAECKYYYLYFIKERFLLRIPTLIYETKAIIPVPRSGLSGAH